MAEIATTTGDEKRFEDFFSEGKYIAFKNHLYNYTIRKYTVERLLSREDIDLVLEVGSGISPVMTKTERIVYSELSPRALRKLKQIHGKGWYVAADSTRLPFKDGAFSHAISSEVFEHIENDEAAMGETARAVRSGGKLLVSVPHRRAWYRNDDRFVKHFRRYEAEELRDKLMRAGAGSVSIEKVMGPLEKLTMMVCCKAVSTLQGFREDSERVEQPSQVIGWFVPAFKWLNRAYACVCWVDARVMPLRWAAVIMAVAEKR